MFEKFTKKTSVNEGGPDPFDQLPEGLREQFEERREERRERAEIQRQRQAHYENLDEEQKADIDALCEAALHHSLYDMKEKQGVVDAETNKPSSIKIPNKLKKILKLYTSADLPQSHDNFIDNSPAFTSAKEEEILRSAMQHVDSDRIYFPSLNELDKSLISDESLEEVSHGKEVGNEKPTVESISNMNYSKLESSSDPLISRVFQEQALEVLKKYDHEYMEKNQLSGELNEEGYMLKNDGTPFRFPSMIVRHDLLDHVVERVNISLRDKLQEEEN